MTESGGYKNIATLNSFTTPPLPWVFPCAVKHCPIIMIKNINNYKLLYASNDQPTLWLEGIKGAATCSSDINVLEIIILVSVAETNYHETLVSIVHVPFSIILLNRLFLVIKSLKLVTLPSMSQPLSKNFNFLDWQSQILLNPFCTQNRNAVL